MGVGGGGVRGTFNGERLSHNEFCDLLGVYKH